MKQFDKNRMNEILNSKDFGISETKGASGILARLFRTTLMDLNVKPGQFDDLLHQASREAKEKSSSRLKTFGTAITKYFTVGNLRRELEKSQMTFKVFLKGIRLLKAYKFDIAIKLYFKNTQRPYTVHVVSVDLGEIKTSIFDDDVTENYIEPEEGEEIFKKVNDEKENNS